MLTLVYPLLFIPVHLFTLILRSVLKTNLSSSGLISILLLSYIYHPVLNGKLICVFAKATPVPPEPIVKI
jgi:hypothetical protein